MNHRRLSILGCLVLAGSAFAAKPAPGLAIPAQSIAVKKESLFIDDFEGAEPAKVWH